MVCRVPPPALPAPQRSPSRTYSWRDSVPGEGGALAERALFFQAPRLSLLSKRRKSHRNHKSPGRGGGGVREVFGGPRERAPPHPLKAPRRSPRRPLGTPESVILFNGVSGGGTHTHTDTTDRSVCVCVSPPPPSGRWVPSGAAPHRPASKTVSQLGGVGKEERGGWWWWAGVFQPCEKRLVPPSAGNGAHLSKHISTCQRDLCGRQLKKALASAGTPGLPREIKGARRGF